MSKAPELLKRLEAERSPFEVRSFLMQGRLMHLRGKYRGAPNNPDDLGANKLYMNARLPKRELDRLFTPMAKLREVDPNSPFLQNLPQDAAEAQTVYEARVANAFRTAIWSKDNASIWLAMIAFDKQEFDVARNHLTRLLENPDSKWLQSARYNLGRALEAIGVENEDAATVEKAIEIFEADTNTPQHAGNLLRAQWLREQL